jgi:uncharacterized phage-associated protein
MASAVDAAAYAIELIGGPCSTMKLQKLLYYSQGWSLAWDGQPIFSDPIEAWANGPVVPAVFQCHRGRFRIEPAEWRWGDPSNLTDDERQTVQVVVEHYGKYSGQELSAMTHQERPWVEARKDVAPGDRSNAVIDLDTMQDYFGFLAASN